MFSKLDKYALTIEADEKTIDDILHDVRSINHIYYYAKEDNLLFKGCRRNWFPLFLACRGIIRHGNKDDMSRINIAALLKWMGSREEYHSFYIDGYCRDDRNRRRLVLIYRSRMDCSTVISKIFGFYGLKMYSNLAIGTVNKELLRELHKIGLYKVEF